MLGVELGGFGLREQAAPGSGGTARQGEVLGPCVLPSKEQVFINICIAHTHGTTQCGKKIVIYVYR